MGHRKPKLETTQIRSQHRILHPRQTNSPIPLELHKPRTLNQHTTMVEQTPRKTNKTITTSPMELRQRRRNNRRMVQQKNPKPTTNQNTRNPPLSTRPRQPIIPPLLHPHQKQLPQRLNPNFQHGK